MAEPSFQDVFKLMNSMVSFEELLDATALKPETCVSLGIHEKFKQLHEKLAKYVQHEETKDLTFQCVCNVCCNEIKILNCDIRTSVAIHNAGELHRVAAKMREMNTQGREFGGKSVQQKIGFKNLPYDDNVLKPAGELAISIQSDGKECSVDLETKSVSYLNDLKNIPKELFKITGDLSSTTTAKNVDLQVDSQERNLDVETQSVLHLIDFNIVPCESSKSPDEVANNVAAKDVQMKDKGQDLKLNTTSVGQLIDLNNIPSELIKPPSNSHSISQDKGFVSNDLNADVSPPCATCQQVFCVCGYKDHLLNQKMSNVNSSRQGGSYSAPPPPLFPGGNPPPPRHREPNATTTTTRGRHRSPPSQQTNRRAQEKRSASLAATNQPRQYLNVHVHMPPSGGHSAEAFTQPAAAPHHRQPKNRNNVHVPPSFDQSARPVAQPAAAPHHRQPKNRNNVHVPPSFDQSARPVAQPVATPRYYQPQNKKNTVEENLELLRSKTLGHRDEMQLMYKMLRQAEGGYWRRSHFDKVFNKECERHEYVCNVCNTGSYMNCSLQVVQHVMGKSHQKVLRAGTNEDRADDDSDRDRSECVVM